MNAYVFATQASALACAAAVDAALGYPKASKPAGGGIHRAASPVTTTHFTPVQHPTLLTWAYISEPVADGILQPQAVALGLPAATSLDATWFPAQQGVSV